MSPSNIHTRIGKVAASQQDQEDGESWYERIIIISSFSNPSIWNNSKGITGKERPINSFFYFLKFALPCKCLFLDLNIRHTGFQWSSYQLCNCREMTEVAHMFNLVPGILSHFIWTVNPQNGLAFNFNVIL